MFMTAPQPTRDFEWTQAPWGIVLRCIPLAAAADHFFTTNNLTLRDDPGEWVGVAEEIGVAREDLLLVRQVHEATVAVASADRSRPWPRPDADVIVSNDRSAAPVIRVADCVPILLADESGRAVAAIHAGWRGTARRAAIAGVGALQTIYGVRPERIIAAVGPAIGPCCYEVSEATYQAFREIGHHASILARWFEPRAGGAFDARQHPHRRAVHEDTREHVPFLPGTGRESGADDRSDSGQSRTPRFHMMVEATSLP
jgi:YfiH family protein